MLLLFGAMVASWPVMDAIRCGVQEEEDVIRWMAKQSLTKLMFYQGCIFSGMLFMMAGVI